MAESRFPLVLAAAFVLLARPVVHAEGLTKAEVAKLGKAASVFVQVKTATAAGSGSGFCVHPSGFFITNEHVIHDATEVSVVLNASLKDQKVLKAKVIRSDKQLDLALLQVEGEKDLPTLALGTVDKLIELQEVIACGFPFGQNLATDKTAYPAISIGSGSITSLREKDGALHRIQLDVELNPGNSGGPLLDLNGKVIGVVVSGIKTARVNFAIPVTHVTQFVDKPEFQFTPPPIGAANVHTPIVFQARALSILPAAKPFDVELEVSAGGVNHRHKMDLADGAYSAKVTPVAKPEGPNLLRAALKFAEGTVEAPVADFTFKVGDRELKLGEVRSIAFKEKASIALRDGKTVEGAVSGLDAVQVRLGGEKVALNFAKAEKVTVVTLSEVVSVSCSIVVSKDGKEIGRVTRVVAIEDGAGRLYLADLEESFKKMGPWELGKGVTGDPTSKSPITVADKKYPKALGMHPDSIVKYKLDKSAKLFKATVCIDDTNKGRRTGEVGFEVYGDGKLLWSSKAITGQNMTDECIVEVTGVDELELRTRMREGSNFGAHAVWLDPYVVK